MANRRDLLRALVGLMKTLAAAYGIMIPASQRAATDEEVKKWYKKLIRRVHPDKGGCNGDFRKLHGAYEDWKGAEPQVGRPQNTEEGDAVGGLVAGAGGME